MQITFDRNSTIKEDAEHSQLAEFAELHPKLIAYQNDTQDKDGRRKMNTAMQNERWKAIAIAKEGEEWRKYITLDSIFKVTRDGVTFTFPPNPFSIKPLNSGQKLSICYAVEGMLEESGLTSIEKSDRFNIIPYTEATAEAVKDSKWDPDIEKSFRVINAS